ncbi:unnamed protein product, partial [Porites evermanni]
MITRSIVFLLKGSSESGYSFEALGTCISPTATTGYINVQIVKLLKNSATLADRLQPLMEGHTVAWPQNLVALYKTSEETAQNANNSKGGEGNNVANDLKEEHFVQFDKKLLKGMVAQKTLKAVERSTSASTSLRKIIENFDEKTGVHPPSTAHTYQNAEKDQKEMIATVCGLKPFQEVPGRCHSSFPHMPRSPFDLVDIRILEQWLTTSKQKLSKDPDTPW